MSHAVLVTILSSGVGLMVPILWAALGEVISETAGVLNIGIEGVMLVGAFVAAIVLKDTGSFVLAGLAAVPAGLLCGLLLGFLYVRRGTDQIVTGIMFNLIALGVTTALYEQFLTGAQKVRSVPAIGIPLLKDIPVVGPTLFDQTLLVYLAILVAVLIFYLLRRTWFGLYLSAVGSRPLAADTAGLSVRALRTTALVIGCGFVALGGASIIITQSGNFVPDVTAGQGYIALAVVVLGRFKPLWIVAGAALFGVSTAMQFQAQNVSWLSSVPSEFWLAVPYLVTIVAVVIAKSSRYPDAIAVPYPPRGSTRS